eukprot:scpid44202/ scgid26522/ 
MGRASKRISAGAARASCQEKKSLDPNSNASESVEVAEASRSTCSNSAKPVAESRPSVSGRKIMKTVRVIAKRECNNRATAASKSLVSGRQFAPPFSRQKGTSTLAEQPATPPHPLSDLTNVEVLKDAAAIAMGVCSIKTSLSESKPAVAATPTACEHNVASLGDAPQAVVQSRERNRTAERPCKRPIVDNCPDDLDKSEAMETDNSPDHQDQAPASISPTVPSSTEQKGSDATDPSKETELVEPQQTQPSQSLITHTEHGPDGIDRPRCDDVNAIACDHENKTSAPASQPLGNLEAATVPKTQGHIPSRLSVSLAGNSPKLSIPSNHRAIPVHGDIPPSTENSDGSRTKNTTGSDPSLMAVEEPGLSVVLADQETAGRDKPDAVESEHATVLLSPGMQDPNKDTRTLQKGNRHVATVPHGAVPTEGQGEQAASDGGDTAPLRHAAEVDSSGCLATASSEPRENQAPDPLAAIVNATVSESVSTVGAPSETSSTDTNCPASSTAQPQSLIAKHKVEGSADIVNDNEARAISTSPNSSQQTFTKPHRKIIPIQSQAAVPEPATEDPLSPNGASPGLAKPACLNQAEDMSKATVAKWKSSPANAASPLIDASPAATSLSEHCTQSGQCCSVMGECLDAVLESLNSVKPEHLSAQTPSVHNTLEVLLADVTELNNTIMSVHRRLEAIKRRHVSKARTVSASRRARQYVPYQRNVATHTASSGTASSAGAMFPF